MNYNVSNQCLRSGVASAAVLGQDVEIDVDQQRLAAAIGQISHQKPIMALRWYSRTLDKIISRSQALYETSKKRRLFPAELEQLAGLEKVMIVAPVALGTVFPDLDPAKVDPNEWEQIRLKIQRIAGMYGAIGVGAEIRNRIDEALRNYDLESPYVGPGERRRTIAWAYEDPLDDPHKVALRAKYNKDGTLKSGEPVVRIDPAQRLAFLHKHYAEVGAPAPELPTAEQAQQYFKAVGYTPPTDGEKPGGIGIGTIAAIGAAVAAFLALR